MPNQIIIANPQGQTPGVEYRDTEGGWRPDPSDWADPTKERRLVIDVGDGYELAAMSDKMIDGFWTTSDGKCWGRYMAMPYPRFTVQEFLDQFRDSKVPVIAVRKPAR